MSIVDRFPVRENILPKGGSVTYELDGKDQDRLGVLLSRSDTAVDWLEVNYNRGRVNIGLNVTEKGKSFVTEKYSAELGESFVFGRGERPWMHKNVSRKHVGIEAVRRGVMVSDLYSMNGTSIWLPSDLDDGKRSEDTDDTPFDQDEAGDEEKIRPEMIEVENLREKYGAEFVELELVDYGILSTIIKSHPDALSSRREKFKVVTLIHPDRNITGDKKRSHQLYILALRVLNIQL